MGGASARQLQSRCKMYSCFCKSRKMYIQIRVPTYNHNYFVLHCCFGFSASARNDVTARASSWLVNAARISAKVQIFQLARIARKKRSIRAASFARIAPQDWILHLCIDLTYKSCCRKLCSNAGSTHTSIYQTQTLDMTLSKFTQLFWSTVARPVLSWTCPVKPLYGLGHRAAAQFQGLCNLLIAYTSGSQPRSWRTPNTAHFASLLESLQMSWWYKSGVFD